MTSGMNSHVQCARRVNQLNPGSFASLALSKPKLSPFKRMLMRAINLIFLRTLTDMRGENRVSLFISAIYFLQRHLYCLFTNLFMN